jgi:hypothetical protein
MDLIELAKVFMENPWPGPVAVPGGRWIDLVKVAISTAMSVEQANEIGDLVTGNTRLL